MAMHTIKGVKLHEVEAVSEERDGRRELNYDIGDLRAGEAFSFVRETKRGVVVHLRGRR